jgi:hypothetical protein
MTIIFILSATTHLRCVFDDERGVFWEGRAFSDYISHGYVKGSSNQSAKGCGSWEQNGLGAHASNIVHATIESHT